MLVCSRHSMLVRSSTRCATPLCHTVWQTTQRLQCQRLQCQRLQCQRLLCQRLHQLLQLSQMLQCQRLHQLQRLQQLVQLWHTLCRLAPQHLCRGGGAKGRVREVVEEEGADG